MAFFCENSGVRIVAPGIAKSAGGSIQEYDGSPAHMAAEAAAARALAGAKLSPSEIAVSTEGIMAAAKAAAALLEEGTAPAQRLTESGAQHEHQGHHNAQRHGQQKPGDRG